jgi:hypothetical protein
MPAMRKRLYIAAVVVWPVALILLLASGWLETTVLPVGAFEKYRIRVDAEFTREFEPGRNKIVLPEVFDPETQWVTASVGLEPGEPRVFMGVAYAMEIRAGSGIMQYAGSGGPQWLSTDKQQRVIEAVYAAHPDFGCVPVQVFLQSHPSRQHVAGVHMIPLRAGVWTIAIRLAGAGALVLGIVLAIGLGVVEIRRSVRRRRGRCLCCGYPRQGLPSQAPCPECGDGSGLSEAKRV